MTSEELKKIQEEGHRKMEADRKAMCDRIKEEHDSPSPARQKAIDFVKNRAKKIKEKQDFLNNQKPQ